MPLVKIPAIKAPSVSLYIRITDEKGRRRYERVRPRSLQPCGPRDNYALLYYVPKMTWEQVGQDYNVRRRATKEHELLQAARDKSASPIPHPTCSAYAILLRLGLTFLTPALGPITKGHDPYASLEGPSCGTPLLPVLSRPLR